MFFVLAVEFRIIKCRNAQILFSFDITRNRIFFDIMDSDKVASVIDKVYSKLMQLYTVETVVIQKFNILKY